MQGRTHRRTKRLLGWHLLLALVMLLMQQAGLRHALQHAARDEGVPTHTVCVECLAHHASDNGVAPTVPTLTQASLDHVLMADAAQPQCGQGVACAYLSRAPPPVLAA
ncbi:MAG: hypothetical protein HYX44_01305 [Aquabacterium sp.]|nr:hypothetical protein [Aquabacterium sp.]